MESKKSGIIVLPASIKTYSWLITILLLIGLTFLGDRTPSPIITAALIVISANIFILIFSSKIKHLLFLACIGTVGALSLSYLVYNDLIIYGDYVGGLLKSIIYILYFFTVKLSLKEMGYLK